VLRYVTILPLVLLQTLPKFYGAEFPAVLQQDTHISSICVTQFIYSLMMSQ